MFLLISHLFPGVEIEKAFFVFLCSLLQNLTFSIEMRRRYVLLWVCAFDKPVGLLDLVLELFVLLIRMCPIAHLLEYPGPLRLCHGGEDFLRLAHHHGVYCFPLRLLRR